MINLKMTEQTFTAVADWAERIQMMTQDNNLINAQDIVHDVFGMLRDDEHFLPRLWQRKNWLTSCQTTPMMHS